MRKIITLALLLATTLGGFAQAKKSTPSAKPTTNSTTAQIIFQGTFPQHTPEKVEPKLIYSARIGTEITVKAKEVQHQHQIDLKVLQGKAKELVFALGGKGDIYNVVAKGISHWSIRKESSGRRSLVIVPVEKSQAQPKWSIRVSSWQKMEKLPASVMPLVLTPRTAAMFDGTVTVKTLPLLETKVTEAKNVSPLKEVSKDTTGYRFSGESWSMKLSVAEANPELRIVRLEDFNLTGTIVGDTAAFKLTGTAIVRHPEGGTLNVLSGSVALTGYQEEESAKLEYILGNYRMKFATNGEFPVVLEFNAQISDSNNWKNIAFAPASAPLREVTISGLTKETQVHFIGAAEAKWVGKDYVSFLPTGGAFNLRWQEVKKEEEGKLFYSVSGLGQVTVSPGMVRQMTVLDYKVMQGEFRELNLTLEGNGSITRVEGANILGWTSTVGNGKGTINVKLNQAQKGDYQLIVHTQTPLGAFPMKIEPVRVLPVDAIRYGGYLRVVNLGAVRLEVLNAPGLAQISPKRFPQTKTLPGLNARQLEQAFAFRFSGPQFGLEIQADNILPELAVSQLLTYKLGETEIQIDAELELDIREAPLREFTMTIPDGYTIAQLNVPNYGDHLVTAETNGGPATLRIQFSQPLINRQVAQLRLTKNHDSPPTSWPLPKVAPNDVKSLRGFVGVSADAGLRLSEGSVSELTEIATAFFPKKIADLQLAYRLRDENWTATVNSERLELSVQADTLHLFSLGQGIAYGSSLFNYAISGAPVSVLRLEVPANYSNVEFVGNEIRNWNKTTNGYEIHLHTPISGTYSLVATYDMKFNSGGDVVTFGGLTPRGVQSEQGYVVVVSSHQFKTEEDNVSPGLITLEKGEVPVEYRLLLDAPMLAAYQYTSRPFLARLKLSSLGQGDTVNQVVDRAVIQTRISSEGNALTDITYLVKSKGFAHLRIIVPEPATLWSAHVQGRKVVPVRDQAAHLIPLPQNVVPNTIIPVRLNIAAKSGDERKIHLALPILSTPILLAGWEVTPDSGHRLEYQDGVLAPQDDPIDVSGFAWITNAINGWQGKDEQIWCWVIGVLLLVGSIVWHWATSDGTYRFGWKNGVFGLIGVAAILTAMSALVWLAYEAGDRDIVHREALRFMIPVQDADTALSVNLANLPTDEKGAGLFSAWPIVLGLAVWFYMFLEQRGITRRLGVALGWMLVFWGCLRMDNGAREFFIAAILFVIVHVAMPLIVRQGGLPKRPKPPKADPPADEPDEPAAPSGSAAGAPALLIAGLFLSGGNAEAAKRVVQQKLPAKPEVVMNSLTQTATVKGDQVYVTANGEWHAEAGQSIDFLRQPAVLKRVRLPEGKVKLTEANENRRNVYRLTAISNGTYRISFDYEVGVSAQHNVRGFNLPTHYGLVNRVTLNLDRAGQDIETTSAVSVEPVGDAGSKFELVMSPTVDARIGWKPLSRDVRTEQVIFYTEQRQLFIPAAGVIEGIHEAKVQAARGQVSDLTYSTPDEMTITDVAAPALKAWRFDPDTKKLRLQFTTPQTGPFNVRVTSQFTGGTLPFEREIGLLRIDGASSQIGQVGVATGSEVVLENVEAAKFTRINLEDFPAALVGNEQKRIAGLTLRRAFRYSNLIQGETIKLSASAVQPDIRVGSSQTLSLGEDRTVLSVRLNANITRAGVFKLSFVMPENLDVDSITGSALSHWTGLKSDTNRIVTLHLKGKTLGAQQFNLSLVGPGPTTTNAWSTPRIAIREANKESGQLVVVPEQGMRLHVADRNGLTQLDPKKSGITQRGVLVFNLLHANWQLDFNIEKVDPWIQVTSLQDVTVREGQLKVSAWLDYKIENAGVKTLSVEVPAGADAVQFTGEHVVDSVRGAVRTNVWEIKLQRRVIGSYRLNVTWQSKLANEQVVANVSGLRPLGSDLHRGFLSLRTSGRLDVRIPSIPPSLQRVDWQSIPANLRGLAGNEANRAFRSLEQEYTLDVNVVRHDAAQLLPARVESTELSSVLSDSGMMLTSVKLMIHPGDMRSLRFKISTNAVFWFATVNHASVRPWVEADQILLPLEQNTKPNQAVPVEFLYSIQTRNEQELHNLAMNGPQFDLPLENIVWKIYLPPAWELKDWNTKLQIHEQTDANVPLSLDLQSYVQAESTAQQKKTQEAEQQLAIGNQFLAEGRQKQARQAFRNAYSLSQHDVAFNEDARVQLQKLKMQQAVVGLNFRRHVNQKMVDAEVAKKPNASLQILQADDVANYTQEQVRLALRDNDSTENSVLMRLAENLVEQQDAAQAVPEAIRASVPEQGNIYTFTRSIQVDKWADLSVQLKTSTHTPSSTSSRALILGVLFLASLIYMFAAKRRPEL
ncbi:MAG: hypothetical protein ACPGVU_04060 [Limisphaerales bacterium]